MFCSKDEDLRGIKVKYLETVYSSISEFVHFSVRVDE